MIEPMISGTIQKILQSAVEKAGYDSYEARVSQPSQKGFGDYSSPIALKIAKKEKLNPMDIAQKIVENVVKNDIAIFEIAKPGFINARVAESEKILFLTSILKDSLVYEPHSLGKEKKIMVEYAHPNTHKLFHIGHLRNITTGEVIARMFEAVGNTVVRVNYQGDVGLHIAKCLWRVKQITDKKGREFLREMDIKDKISFLGKSYAEGNSAYENEEEKKQEIISINRMIYQQNGDILSLWKETREWSLTYFNEIYQLLGTSYDKLYFESQFADRSLQIVQEAVQNGILEKSDGAIVLKGDSHGVDTRVFVNNLGFPTYEGKELGLAEKEFTDFGTLDKCIHVVAGEQTSFFKTTFKTQELINPEKYHGKQLHIIYGWVDVKGQKMSSRKGNIVEGTWLIQQVQEEIEKEFGSKSETALKLAIASIKYMFLKNGLQTDIAFDLSEAISIKGNSGPYLLYTYVRCLSILNKFDGELHNVDGKEAVKAEENALLSHLIHYPEIVEEAAKGFAPNYICSYLYELAQTYNVFYQKLQILSCEGEQTKQFRLALTKAVSLILKKGLYLLGIETVEKM